MFKVTQHRKPKTKLEATIIATARELVKFKGSLKDLHEALLYDFKREVERMKLRKCNIHISYWKEIPGYKASVTITNGIHKPTTATIQ